MQLGAAGVQLATRFIATDECDADLRFKQAVVNAQAKDIKIIHSPVGMPARAVQSPLLDRLERGEKFPALYCNNCLSACPKSDKTPYCISRALIEAVNGNWEDGLFFCGENADRVKKIVSVKELMETLMREYNEN
jgi:NAD(P)H-dependent flavin oxidoreductase YrpB (nitropropane dioxygenase family)